VIVRVSVEAVAVVMSRRCERPLKDPTDRQQRQVSADTKTRIESGTTAGADAASGRLDYGQTERGVR